MQKKKDILKGSSTDIYDTVLTASLAQLIFASWRFYTQKTIEDDQKEKKCVYWLGGSHD